MAIALIESLDHQGRGVAHVDRKAIFISGALPGETVEYASFRQKAGYELAECVRILKPSAQRVTPLCPHFATCGGCSMQHLNAAGQLAAKQRVLEDALWHIARLRALTVYAPIVGIPWGYRWRARFSVRRVEKKGGVLIGFHERKSSFVADMDSCAVLPLHVSRLLPELRGLVDTLSIRSRLPQIELAATEEQTALVLRILAPLTAADKTRLRQFATQHALTLYLQAGGPQSATLFHPVDAPPLAYALPEFDLRLSFAPTEFTQVNPAVNRLLLRRAMQLLQPLAGERIADLFCGLGNFSLPIARLGAAVLGIEGIAGLVERARQNAAANGLAERCEFAVADLFAPTTTLMARLTDCAKWLLDPPREGAIDLIKALAGEAKSRWPRRLVYVSCNPATLARDAAVLAHELGYRLRGAGVLGMFPHTAHVESIALFEHP